ncbi:hypothetical protein Tco_0068949, partial [Tanacetum coccineum]
MDILSFIQIVDPTKVRVGERYRVDDQLVSEAVETFVKDAAPVQPRCQRKRKTIVYDAGGPSHPPKKLREDHETPSGPPVGDSSHHSGANITEAEVDSFVRPSVPLMTVATTVTSTVDPATT